jgi:hypothetical protein
MDRDVKAMTDKWREWCEAYDGKVPLDRIPNLLAAVVKDERERCAKLADNKAVEFLSPEYATGQPLSSFAERFACTQVAEAIRDGTAE